jgi:predicted ribosomally synthesized peptide with SipW-like signal peptide
MKIKKIGKSSFVIAILSFVLVAVLAFGGTYAYFTAKTNNVHGSVTTGHLNIDPINATGVKGTVEGNALTFANPIVVPNEVLVNSVFSTTVKNNIDFYSRVKFSVKITLSEDVANHKHYTETDYELDDYGNATAEENTATDADDCKDYIEHAINALIILNNTEATAKLSANLPTDPTAKADVEAAIAASTTTWTRGTLEGSTDTETTAYFYNLKKHAASDVVTGTKLYFPVYVQLEDFLGRALEDDATRCPYWMDAKIEISISFEVMQANCIEGAAVQADGSFVSDTEAKAAWDIALGQTNA